jgi:hypothetical protein
MTRGDGIRTADRRAAEMLADNARGGGVGASVIVEE